VKSSPLWEAFTGVERRRITSYYSKQGNMLLDTIRNCSSLPTFLFILACCLHLHWHAIVNACEGIATQFFMGAERKEDGSKVLPLAARPDVVTGES
jgi:hypothetical protein